MRLCNMFQQYLKMDLQSELASEKATGSLKCKCLKKKFYYKISQTSGHEWREKLQRKSISGLSALLLLLFGSLACSTSNF